MLRAAAVTGGVVGALSLTAACAPDGKFLAWGGPLAIGLGGVCMACLGKCIVLCCCSMRVVQGGGGGGGGVSDTIHERKK